MSISIYLYLSIYLSTYPYIWGIPCALQSWKTNEERIDYMFIYKTIYISISISIYICIYIRIYISIYIYRYAHIYIYIYMHV